MNKLEIIVAAILVLFTILGYYKGFLRMAYSIAAWFITAAFVLFATPYVADFLENNTNLKSVIQEKCADYIEDAANQKAQQQMQDFAGGQEGQNQDEAMEQMLGAAALAAGGILKGSGIYEEMAEQAARSVIRAIAFLLALFLMGIVTFWISHMLKLVSKIPIIQGPNRMLGAVAGGLKGLVLVWVIFYLMCLFADGGIGAEYLGYVEESSFLRMLYENNILMEIMPPEGLQ